MEVQPTSCSHLSHVSDSLDEEKYLCDSSRNDLLKVFDFEVDDMDSDTLAKTASRDGQKPLGRVRIGHVTGVSTVPMPKRSKGKRNKTASSTKPEGNCKSGQGYKDYVYSWNKLRNEQKPKRGLDLSKSSVSGPKPSLESSALTSVVKETTVSRTSPLPMKLTVVRGMFLRQSDAYFQT